MTNFRARLVTIPAAIFQRIKDQNPHDVLVLAQVALIVVGFASCLGEGYYNGKWEALEWALGLLVVSEIWRRYGCSIALMIAYLFGSTTWMLEYSNRYSTISPYDLLALKYFAAHSIFKLLLVMLPFLACRFDRSFLEMIGRLAALVFTYVSLFQTYWEWAWSGCGGVNSCGGALKNPSINAAMLVVLLPFGPWWMIFPVAGAAMLGKSSIGIGMCAIYAAMRVYNSRARIAMACLAPLLLAAGYFSHGNKEFFNSSGRFQMWIFFMKLWAKNWRNVWFGTGFGTFGIFSTNLQTAFNMNPTDWWIWMHNDWLQMAFECGVIGLALMVLVYLAALRKLYENQDWKLMQSFLLFGVMLGCEYPLHLAPSCLYTAWILAVALMQVKKPAAIFSDKY